jgi:hypothetical protein
MWLCATAVLAGIMAVETVHGILRGLFLEPALGAFRARQLSVFTASALIFLIALATVRWIGATNEGELLNIGVLWVALALAFELSLGWASGAGGRRIWEDYDMANGGLMPLGMLFLSFAPWLASRTARGFRLYHREPWPQHPSNSRSPMSSASRS